MTTEREKFEAALAVEWPKIATINDGAFNFTKHRYDDGYIFTQAKVAWVSWQACAEQKQAEIDRLSDLVYDSGKQFKVEIDALRAELDNKNQQIKLYVAEMAGARDAGWYSAQELFHAYQRQSAELEQVNAHNAMLFDALKAMIDDGWLHHGSEGMDEAQLKVRETFNATSEQIESYKQTLIAKAKEDQLEQWMLLRCLKETKVETNRNNKE